jgi:hypothetical protein
MSVGDVCVVMREKTVRLELFDTMEDSITKGKCQANGCFAAWESEEQSFVILEMARHTLETDHPCCAFSERLIARSCERRAGYST